jgi:hypothetical protein
MAIHTCADNITFNTKHSHNSTNLEELIMDRNDNEAISCESELHEDTHMITIMQWKRRLNLVKTTTVRILVVSILSLEISVD